VRVEKARLPSPSERVFQADYDVTFLDNPQTGEPMALMFLLQKLQYLDDCPHWWCEKLKKENDCICKDKALYAQCKHLYGKMRPNPFL